MAYSHSMGMGPRHAPGAVDPNILYRNVHTGLRQRKVPGSTVSNYGHVPVQYE